MGIIRKTAGSTPAGRPRAEWSDVRCFLAVADLGSFSAAARALGTTQPTVSKRVEELEGRLGARLITRASGSSTISLTDIGLLIRDHARSMERSAQAIERLAYQADKNAKGRVRIATPDGLATFWLAPRLPDFHRENPQIALMLNAGLWTTFDEVEPVDISLQFHEEKRLDAVATELATFHYALFAAPSYIASYGVPQTLADIANHRIIHHTAQSHQKETWHPKAEALQNLWDAALVTNSSAAMMMAVMRGAGIGALPTGVVSFVPDLVMIGPGPMAKLRLWMVTDQSARKTVRVRRVIDWLLPLFDRASCPWFLDEFVHPDEFRLAPSGL